MCTRLGDLSPDEALSQGGAVLVNRQSEAFVPGGWREYRRSVGYPAHFVSKLTDADGELQETQHWVGRAKAYGYMTADRHADRITRCKSAGRKLGKMMQNPSVYSGDRPLPAAGLQMPEGDPKGSACYLLEPRRTPSSRRCFRVIGLTGISYAVAAPMPRKGDVKCAQVHLHFNLLQAHRSHLYQRLVIAGHSHTRVTVAYGCLAVLGAVLVLPLIKPSVQGSSPVPAALGVLAAAFLALWRWTVASEQARGKGREARGQGRNADPR